MPAPDGALDADRARLIETVREAGAIARSFFRGTFKSWSKEGDSPVSEADIASNDLLRARLPQPGDGWLSEESEHDPSRAGAQRVWIVDPIDGTRAFIAGREDWCISVALAMAGRPVLGALYAPATDELFVATAGQGATRNGIILSIETPSAAQPLRFAGPKRMLDTLAAREPRIVAVPRIHSLALRIARVATGEIDGAIAGGSAHDWDLAAADLLVHEARGAMGSLDGRPLIYNRPDPVHGVLFASARAGHAEMLALMRGDGDDRPAKRGLLNG